MDFIDYGFQSRIEFNININNPGRESLGMLLIIQTSPSVTLQVVYLEVCDNLMKHDDTSGSSFCV